MMQSIIAVAVFALTAFPVVVEIIKVHGVFFYHFLFLITSIIDSFSGVFHQMLAEL